MSALERPTVRLPALGIVPFTRKAWPSMTRYLREKVGQAERGEIRALTVVVEYDNGDMGSQAFHGEHSCPVKMLGEIELLKVAMLHHEAERRG